MRRPALGVKLACFLQAELTVDRQPDLAGVIVFLAVILPPADGAKPERAWRFEGFISTAGATIAGRDGFHLT